MDGLEAGETYSVTIVLGDATFKRDKMQVRVPAGFGTLTDGLAEVTDVSTAAGQFAHRTFLVTPNGSGQLQLQFSDTGGDPYWTAGAIHIWDSPVKPLTVTGPVGNEFTVTNFTAGALYTVSTTAGSGGRDGRGSVLRRGAGGGSVVGSVHVPGDAAGGRRRGDGDGGGGHGLGVGFDDRDVRGGVGAAVRLQRLGEHHAERVRGGAREHGLHAGGGLRLGRGGAGVRAEDRDAAAPGRALRPGGRAHTFQIKVDLGTEYAVRVYAGDPTFRRDKIEVTVEGATPYTIGTLAAGSYDVRTRVATGVSADGVLRVTFRDLGGDPYWVVNGIDVWATTATPPGEQALRAAIAGCGISEIRDAGSASPCHPVTLSPCQL